ncbi:response regulator transcription factor [Jiangella anatolica]|uniref:Two-component system response regulator n=1 Tax=Jiangella anatolica TaxID=2670374 RepID=A0A2W2BMH5_9ACTN|nr:response regulator transcription factor [Jiangella anatolica]PZF81488.1 two-component system response regulator [Jiangella anatolica]
MTGDQDRALLLVEDDAKLAALLDRLFTGEGYAVDVARDGQSGLHHALTRTYAVMVIDRGLPAIEGVDLVRRLRARGVATPILVLTARGTTEDRVEGLDAGAEDYVVKPFEIDELLARLRALLRRHTDTSARLDLGERYLDVAARRVLGGGAAPIELSGRENELLQLFAAHPSQVFTRDELRRQVFQDADSPGAVDTYVYYLRRKLGRDVIRTIHGLGYRMGSA